MPNSTRMLVSAGRSSPRSATASPATPRRAARPSPAACRCRRRSARSIPPTSRPTPRPASAAGREAAFQRAMREGVDREGHHLYPAFPYDHFTLRHRRGQPRALRLPDDARAGRRRRRRRTICRFPSTSGSLLAGWKLLYLRRGRVPARSRPERRNGTAAPISPKGLAHCGACHTPRNALGAERRDRHFAGGEAEGWHGLRDQRDVAGAGAVGRGEPRRSICATAGTSSTACRAGRWRAVTGNLGGAARAGRRRRSRPTSRR